MPTIKGPIKISGGFNAGAFLKDKVKDITLKLPFSATGWKSERNADLVKGGSKKEEVVEKPKAEPKPTAKPLKKVIKKIIKKK